MLTYCVTGVAGLIGQEVARQLLLAGHHVVGMDNLNDAYNPALKTHRLQELEDLGAEKNTQGTFTFIKGDIEDTRAVNAMFAAHTFSGIANLAARAGVRASVENPGVYVSTNMAGLLNMLEAARKHGVQPFVQASTSSLYAGCTAPFNEAQAVHNPLSPYAASKLGAEGLCASYSHVHGLRTTAVRYFTVYGNCARPDMSIFGFLEKIRKGETLTLYGDGTQARDFTHVEDIARGTVLALTRATGNPHEVINLGGGGQPISINTMIAMMEAHLEKKANIHHEAFLAADMRVTAANVTKAAQLLNWKPTISFETGIARTAAWHLDNAHWLDKL